MTNNEFIEPKAILQHVTISRNLTFRRLLKCHKGFGPLTALKLLIETHPFLGSNSLN